MTYIGFIYADNPATQIPTEAQEQCQYVDQVSNYLGHSGFFNEIQITYLIGLSLGSILCHYHVGTTVDDVGDRIIELHGSAVKTIIP